MPSRPCRASPSLPPPGPCPRARRGTTVRPVPGVGIVGPSVVIDNPKGADFCAAAVTLLSERVRLVVAVVAGLPLAACDVALPLGDTQARLARAWVSGDVCGS